MKKTRMRYIGCLLLLLVGLAGCHTKAIQTDDQAADQTIALTHLASTASQAFDESAAEIVTFDAANKNILVVNANSGHIDLFSAKSLTALEGANPTATINLGAMLAENGKVADEALVGAANSVDLFGNLAAVAVEAATKTNAGWVVFFDPTTLRYVNAVQVGALPDMLTFTPDGSKVVVANEGEPDPGYQNDPEGSVSIISVADYSVTRVGFSDFNNSAARHAELPIDKMIVDGVNATVAKSFEPEYITVAEDSTKAYVTLQENNAIAVIDLASASVDKIIGLGFKDHSLPGHELDASQKDGLNMKSWPVMGIYMPDSITSFSYKGKTYLLTANEGDSRQDWLEGVAQPDCEATGYFYDSADGDDDPETLCIDEFNAKDFWNKTTHNVTLNSGMDNDGFGDKKSGLQRLKFSYFTTVRMNGGTNFEKLYAYGARSFSIWDAASGELIYDSGSDFERITAGIYGDNFNNDNAENTGDDRSDNKGPEPEGIAVGKINGRTYAFIGLERMGGIMVYDVSNPYAPEYIQYINNRDVSIDFSAGYDSKVGDLGPEGVHFVTATDSPNGKPLVLVGNEVSGTTAVYQIDVIRVQK